MNDIFFIFLDTLDVVEPKRASLFTGTSGRSITGAVSGAWVDVMCRVWDTHIFSSMEVDHVP